MSRTRFHNGQVLLPGGFAAEPLVIKGDRIVGDAGGAACGFDLEGGYLLPGFIDTQVNGGGGVLFNDAPTVQTIAAIGAAHRPYGTTAFLPTLISDDLDKVDAAMRAVEQAIADGVPGVIGIHIEGPFIAPARKGTHDEAKFRRLDARSIALLKSLRAGHTLVTLAPELCDSAEIAELVRGGVRVAAGHTDADYETMRAAFGVGVTGVTHLFNAMSPFTHRAPGAVGAALEDQAVYCGVIADGRHVAWPSLRIALRARPHERFMLVTDAMPTVGSPDKSFVLQGKRVVVRDGVCVGPDGTLAGSDLDMISAVRNGVTELGLGLAEAVGMATVAPAAFLGAADRGLLSPGRRADLLWVDHDLAVRGSWIGGIATFR